MPRLAIELPVIARVVNIALPLLAIGFFLLGFFVSFYFHFLTVTFLFLTAINFYYRHVQTKYTILSNFGFLAQLRYMSESIGPEFRQYFFLSDTEERPFSRVEREEVYRKSKNEDSSSAFGSQLNFDHHEIKIKHSLYPIAAKEMDQFKVTFGEERKLKTAYTITKPFMISAMSYGALGERAVRALSRGAKRAGIAMNTGEGGYPKYHLMEGADLIFQMGTAKFGVRNSDGTLNEKKLKEIAQKKQVKMVEIKFSQGAKPGKGGLLPKEKITQEIADLRGVPMGQDVISPPHHVECTDAKSTVQFISRVQQICGLPVGIKLCLGNGDEFVALVREMKRQNKYPDYIDIDGAEGGTGAAPKSFMDDLGTPLFDALPFVQQTLVEEGVRDKLKLVCSGKLINAGKQIMALAMGADAVYTARGFMLALGCIQALQCNKNTCPAGITTHNPRFQHGLDIEEKAQRITNYVTNLEHDFIELLAATGVKNARDLTRKNLHFDSTHSKVVA